MRTAALWDVMKDAMFIDYTASHSRNLNSGEKPESLATLD
jgi:hypothetical protein